jgi:hypothetical protein
MMKKLLLIAVGTLCVTFMHAQKLKENQVPQIVRNSFQKQYPKTKASWEKEKEGYEASFKQGTTDMSVIINKNGTIIETETDIQVSALPAGILAYIKEHYKGEKVKEAARIVNEKGVVTYEAELKGKDLLFDTNGKFLKEVKKSSEDEEEND